MWQHDTQKNKKHNITCPCEATILEIDKEFAKQTKNTCNGT